MRNSVKLLDETLFNSFHLNSPLGILHWGNNDFKISNRIPQNIEMDFWVYFILLSKEQRIFPMQGALEHFLMHWIMSNWMSLKWYNYRYGILWSYWLRTKLVFSRDGNRPKLKAQIKGQSLPGVGLMSWGLKTVPSPNNLLSFCFIQFECSAPEHACVISR